MNTILDSIIQGLIHDYTRTSLEKLGNWGIILVHIALIFTLLLCFSGHRFKKIFIGIIDIFMGFLMGLFVSSWFLVEIYRYVDIPYEMEVLVVWASLIIFSIGLAVVFGVVGFKCYRFGYFVFISTLLWGSAIDLMKIFSVEMYDRPTTLYILIVIEILIGSLTAKYAQQIIILTTSICGALSSAIYLMCINNLLFQNNITASSMPIIWLALGAVIAAFGAMIQFYITKRQTIQK